MNQREALTKLQSAADSIRAKGAQHLYLFGSTARNEAGPLSDVDLFMDRNPSVPLGLVGLGAIQSYLEALLGTRVDLTTRNGLHPLIREDVEHNAISVF